MNTHNHRNINFLKNLEFGKIWIAWGVCMCEKMKTDFETRYYNCDYGVLTHLVLLLVYHSKYKPIKYI